MTAERQVAAIESALKYVPIAKCDKHDDDDAITCGWKRAVIDVRSAIADPEKWL